MSDFTDLWDWHLDELSPAEIKAMVTAERWHFALADERHDDEAVRIDDQTRRDQEDRR